MNRTCYLLTAIVVLAFPIIAYGEYLEFVLEYDYTAYTETEETGADGFTYTVIDYEGAEPSWALGEPYIPTMAYDAIIPFGSTDVSLEVTDSTYYETEDLTYPLFPGQSGDTPEDYHDQECPECESSEWNWTNAGPVYEEDAAYPTSAIVDESYGLFRGHFASQWTSALVSYNPVAGTVAKLESLTVRVGFTPPEEPVAAERWEWPYVYDRWSDFVKTTVLNPDDVYDFREPVNFVDVIGYDEYEEEGEIIKVAYNQESEYFSSSVPIDNDDSWPEDATYPYPYLIITNNNARYYGEDPEVVNLTSATEFSDFREWKKDKGVPTLRKTVDAIIAQYGQEGDEYWDWQVAIRKFLKAQRKNGFEYVIFIGDVDNFELEGTDYKQYWGKWGVVPIRVLVKEDYDELDAPPGRADVVPSDIYYMDLDINWNSDGDAYFGEPSEIPAFKPDFACGWIPATTASELSGWLGKLLKYEKDPNLEKIGDDTYLHRALHIAADAGLDTRVQCKERRLFSENYVPEGFFRKKMWEGGGGLPSWPLQNWPTYPEPYQVSYEINKGYGMIEVDTHGHIYYFDLITRGDNAGIIQSWASDQIQKNPRVHRTIYPSTVDELFSEKERYGVLYSESCNINDFTFDEHGQLSKPVCERFIFNDHGGSVAFLGTTRSGRWGWTSPWSGRLRNIYYEKLMNKTDDNWDDDAYIIGSNYAWTRYEFFRSQLQEQHKHDLTYMHMLTGDPEMNVWTADPFEMEISITTTPVQGQPYYKVRAYLTYLDGGQRKEVPFANVCLHGTGAYLINVSNAKGKCEFRVPNTTPSGKVTATKHNFVPAVDAFASP